ncbi:MAG: hypothetical protein ACXVB9_04490 [Bdellovibrionota bacterium]
MAILLTMASVPALAEEASTSTAENAAASSSFLERHGKANYLMWLTGPRTEALSGNKDGTGTNLMMRHYPTLGFKFNDDISLTATELMTQTYNDKTDLESRHFTVDDPYLTLDDAKLLHSETYGTNLDAYVRYYVPVSRASRDGFNTGYLPSDTLAPNDAGNGQIRFYLNPTKTFLDGALTFSGAVLANVKLSRLSTEERIARQQTELLKNGGDLDTATGARENAYIFLDPTVTYSVSSKVDLYLEYSTGYLHHSTAGSWTKLTDPNEGQYISPGINWAAAKKLNVNPYISWGPVFQGLTKADLGLQIQYTFL